jgi:hypothetical protein
MRRRAPLKAQALPSTTHGCPPEFVIGPLVEVWGPDSKSFYEAYRRYLDRTPDAVPSPTFRRLRAAETFDPDDAQHRCRLKVARVTPADFRQLAMRASAHDMRLRLDAVGSERQQVQWLSPSAASSVT